MTYLTNAEVADQLPSICERLGQPTSAIAGDRSQVLTWEGLGGDAVVFARSARGWGGVEKQVDAELGGRAAAVIAATGSGIVPFSRRVDLHELLRVCSAPRVARLAVCDLSRIARDPAVLLEVLAQLSELRVAVEAAGGGPSAQVPSCTTFTPRCLRND